MRYLWGLRQQQTSTRFVAVFWLQLTLVARTAIAVPTIAFPINAQVPPVARVATPFNFTFAETTFESDSTSTVYTLDQAPTWLHLDSSSRTFSGSPSKADVGVAHLSLVATDNTGAVAMPVTFIISASAGPAIGEPVDLQLPSFGVVSSPDTLLSYPASAINIHFASETFTNTNAGTVYYAVSANNTPLPSWLAFDAGTLSLSGVTPAFNSPFELPQAFGIHVTASDVVGFSGAIVSFQILIDSHELVFVSKLPELKALPGTSVEYLGLVNSLTLDGKVLNASGIKQVSGLPTWLSFDASTLAITGTTPKNVEDANSTISVTDLYGDVAQSTMSIDTGLLPTAVTTSSKETGATQTIAGADPSSNPTSGSSGSSSSATGTQSTTGSGDSSVYNKKTIAAAVLVPILVLLIALAIFFCFFRQRRKRSTPSIEKGDITHLRPGTSDTATEHSPIEEHKPESPPMSPALPDLPILIHPLHRPTSGVKRMSVGTLSKGWETQLKNLALLRQSNARRDASALLYPAPSENGFMQEWGIPEKLIRRPSSNQRLSKTLSTRSSFYSSLDRSPGISKRVSGVGHGRGSMDGPPKIPARNRSRLQSRGSTLLPLREAADSIPRFDSGPYPRRDSDNSWEDVTSSSGTGRNLRSINELPVQRDSTAWTGSIMSGIPVSGEEPDSTIRVVHPSSSLTGSLRERSFGEQPARLQSRKEYFKSRRRYESGHWASRDPSSRHASMRRGSRAEPVADAPPEPITQVTEQAPPSDIASFSVKDGRRITSAYRKGQMMQRWSQKRRSLTPSSSAILSPIRNFHRRKRSSSNRRSGHGLESSSQALPRTLTITSLPASQVESAVYDSADESPLDGENLLEEDDEAGGGNGNGHGNGGVGVGRRWTHRLHPNPLGGNASPEGKPIGGGSKVQRMSWYRTRSGSQERERERKIRLGEVASRPISYERGLYGEDDVLPRKVDSAFL